MEQPIQKNRELMLASPWRRLAGALIDVALFFAISLVVLSLYDELPNLDSTSNSWGNLDAVWEPGEPSAWAQITFYVVYFLAVACVARRSQTPGKLLTKTYVTKENGISSGFRITLLREFVVMASFYLIIPFIIASLWCVLDKKNQCLWDKIFRTYVTHSPSTSNTTTTIGPQPANIESEMTVSPLHGHSQIAEDLREIDLLLEKGAISEEEHSKRRHHRIHGES
jgi:uncharacterized RDD family membrane protein YckC|tara:strand:+ start:155 stop:829 length:675 start_codon:yes stop_codon:yes gene_type:complete